ncbi:MAG: ABC transporter substrate-binding protein, partial [Chloroflexi bacterium]|nr:ABC transporter substrate-binding protein [Chloroflexota bacterium]
STAASGKNVVFTLGNLTDMTGPASTILAIVDEGLEDMVKYYNENNLIPGITLEVIPYDTTYDPGQAKPGYEWLKQQGADLIVTTLSSAAIVVKESLVEDQMVLFCISSDNELMDQDGWVWSFNDPAYVKPRTLMKWIAGNDWDYETKGPAKIGQAGWVGPTGTDYAAGMEDYCKEHPDQFEWAGSFMNNFFPTWGPEVNALKDCDYVMPPGVGFAIPTFVKEYRNAGGKAKFIGTDSHLGFQLMIAEAIGWDAMDGWLLTYPGQWWNETGEIPDLARTLRKIYHSEGDVSGGPFQSYAAIFQILAATAKRVGPENMTSQTIYDTCSSFSGQFAGYGGWSISLEKRTSWDYEGIYEWSAAEKNAVRADTEWQPIVE